MARAGQAPPAWATEARASAAANLDSLPGLTGREEEWRFTAPSALALDGAEPAAPGAVAVATAAVGGERSARLAFTDGVPAAPVAGTLPDGVIVAELGAALADHEELVRRHLYSLIGFSDRPGALNAARWEAGTFVYVPRGVELTLPVETVLSVTGAEGRVFGRTLVVVEEGAKATVVDRYTSPDLPGAVQASTATELVVLPGGELEHIAFVDWGAGVHHHAVVTAAAHKDARVRSVVVSLGGDVLRAEATMRCVGSGADARALGLYFAAGDQHFEHRVVSRHEAPQAYSNLLYKGALKDTARTVFFGNLVVPPGAPGTDAYQTNRNLVLNEGARADTIPFLEIETAEVKCSHAGAVGRVDDEHLFYLESRGVPEEAAKQLIVLGFLQEVLEQVRFEELRHELEAAVAPEADARMIDVAALEDVPLGGSVRVSVDGRPVCLVRTESGVHAVHDVCTHAMESMTGGYVDGDTIECPRHGAQFSLTTGEALSPPASRPLPLFAVAVEGGRVLVDPTPSHPHPLAD